MRKSKHLPGFILILTLIGILGAPFSLSELAAQDRIPACPPPGKKQKTIKPLREMNWANDTISVQFSFPAAFRGMGRNEIVDSIALLTPVFERLRQVRAGLSEDTVRIVHIGDSHVRGHIYPQTTGARLIETFGAVSYIDKGVNGATCLTFTHPDRIAEIAALKPELLILSFGTNESHNRRYNVNVHYNQMDELVKLLQDSLPNVSETIRRYAKEHRLLVWDMYDVVGGKRRACVNWTEAKLMRPDHVHYLPEGYILQGNLLYQALINAYNDYVSH